MFDNKYSIKKDITNSEYQNRYKILNDPKFTLLFRIIFLVLSKDKCIFSDIGTVEN